MLTICDLNQVIKYYAYQVQQRIDDLDRIQYFPHSQDESTQPEIISVISKYHNYMTKDEKQNKLALKLVQRVLQIFDFFKTKSKNQNLLTMIHQRIQTQISCIMEKKNVNVGQLLSYIRMIAKPGGVIRVKAEKKPALVKSIIRETSGNEPKISPTLSLYNIQRRATSLINPRKHIKTMSLGPEKWKMDEIFDGVWNCLQVQRIHLVRIKEGNQQQSLKQMLRRNDKTLQNIKQYEKRWRLGAAQASEYQGETTILSEMKSNVRNTWTSNVRNAWTSKRKKMVLGRKRDTTLKENMSIIM